MVFYGKKLDRLAAALFAIQLSALKREVLRLINPEELGVGEDKVRRPIAPDYSRQA